MSKYNESRRKWKENHPEKIKEYRKRYRLKHPEKQREYMRKYAKTRKGKLKMKEGAKKFLKTPMGCYGIYQSNARARFILWDLSFEEFKSFWQKPCAYCGDKIETIGLDRINSDEGYDLANVIPCCTKCNRMKSVMNSKEFLAQCRKIIANYILF